MKSNQENIQYKQQNEKWFVFGLFIDGTIVWVCGGKRTKPQALPHAADLPQAVEQGWLPPNFLDAHLHSSREQHLVPRAPLS